MEVRKAACSWGWYISNEASDHKSALRTAETGTQGRARHISKRDQLAHQGRNHDNMRVVFTN